MKQQTIPSYSSTLGIKGQGHFTAYSPHPTGIRECLPGKS